MIDEHGEQTEEDVEPADEPADEEDEPMIVDEPTVFDSTLQFVHCILHILISIASCNPPTQLVEIPSSS